MPIRPSENEEEYIRRQELERIKRLRAEAAREMEQKEGESLKELHWMHCPKCGRDLAEVDFKGVLVDACFACGGMFFDKGEVEKILEEKEPGWLGRATSILFGSGGSGE